MGIHQTPGRVVLDVAVTSGSLKVDAIETNETRIEVKPRNAVARDLMDEVVEKERTLSDGGVGIELRVPRGGLRRRLLREPKFDVTITAPEGSDLRGETVTADFVSTGRLGSCRIRSVSGDSEAAGAREVELKSVSGDVSVNDVEGDAQLESVSGDIRVGHVGGRLTAKSVSGDVRGGAVTAGVKATVISGGLSIDSVVGGDVDVRTTSGDIEIGVAPGASVWMDVSTLSGNANSELEASDGAEGNVTLEIRASSMSGDVRIRRATAVSA